MQNKFKTNRRNKARKARRPAVSARPQKILMPVDLASQSAVAFRQAAALAGQNGGDIILLHVVEPISYVHDFGYGPVQRQRTNVPAIRQAGGRLLALGRKHFPVGQSWAATARSGTVCEEIAKVARELEITLIVMPTRGHMPAEPIHAGNLAARVMRQTPCPVLMLRKPLFGQNRRSPENL
jgi:nucleotide-binding universal stress UspA family protein